MEVKICSRKGIILRQKLCNILHALLMYPRVERLYKWTLVSVASTFFFLYQSNTPHIDITLLCIDIVCQRSDYIDWKMQTYIPTNAA